MRNGLKIIIGNILTKKVVTFKNFCSVVQINGKSSSLEDRLKYDVAIIGAGIIGTSIAREIKMKSKNIKVILIDKECAFAKHQSSHNSGVIHSGVYYKPGSLKAKFCLKGADLVFEYCQNNKIPFKKSGKLIVATECDKINVIKELYERGTINGVKDLKIICNLEEIIKIEPNAKCMQALWSPNTGNVDFQILTKKLGSDFRKCGGDILLNNEVNRIKPSEDCDHPILLKCNQNLFLKSKYLILCGGLQSGTLSDLVEKEDSAKFISFRVDYQLLKKKYIPVNIYEVPDLSVPFLGIHITPRLDGTTLLGPTAVIAAKEEGYTKDEISISYLKNTLTSSEFRNMTRRHLSKCVKQISKQMCPELQIKELQKLAHFSTDEVSPGPTAVQTQLVNKDGYFADDFIFEFFEGIGIRKRIINCKFLPSPAATSALAIADYVAGKFLEEYSGEK